MQQKNNDQNSVIFQIDGILNKMSNQVNFLIRNDKLMNQLDVDLLMENTRKLYDTLCSVKCNMDVDSIPMEVEDVEEELRNSVDRELEGLEGEEEIEEEEGIEGEEGLEYLEEEEGIEEEEEIEDEEEIEREYEDFESDFEEDIEEDLEGEEGLEYLEEEEGLEGEEGIEEEEGIEGLEGEEGLEYLEEEEGLEDEEEIEREYEDFESDFEDDIEEDLEEEEEIEEEEGIEYFEEDEEEVQEEEEDSGIRSYKKVYTIEPQTLGDKLESAGDTSLAARLQRKPVTDLASAIGINDKFLLLNELFGGSMEKYNKSIRALNNFSTLLGAKTYMSELQIEFQWNIESDAYKKLDNLVERRFM